MAVGVRRVALSEVVAEVERKEPGRLPFQLGSHRDGIGVDREVNQRAPTKGDVLRIPVGAVLLDCLLDGLPGQVILQLCGCNRDAIEEQAQVDRLIRLRIKGQLAGDGQTVGVIVGNQFRSNAERWLPVREPDLDVLIADPVPDNVDGTALIDLLGEPLGEPLPSTVLVPAMSLDKLAQDGWVASMNAKSSAVSKPSCASKSWRSSGSVPTLHALYPPSSPGEP